MCPTGRFRSPLDDTPANYHLGRTRWPAGAASAGKWNGRTAMQDATVVDKELIDELVEYLRIPSISSGGGDPRDLERAAAWVRERILAAGGSAELADLGGNPLVVGDLRSRRGGAPDVLIYGHYHVQ